MSPAEPFQPAPSVRQARVEELFALGVELSAKETSALLDQEPDEEIRNEVASLLAAHRRDDARLATPILRQLPSWLARPLRWEGRRLGAWRLERLLGRGGMGSVYLGVRDLGDFPQSVAIKLADRVIGSPVLEQRFASERRILARLDHPGIARLLDGGATEEGIPYLVMELVEGIPINRYARDHGLGLPARIRLFLEVLEAVEVAHRNLVVHRDLKPAHAQVTAAGQVKLLDFGIAKLLDPEPVDETAEELTRLGDLALTPSYASPEQLRGEPITTASDVYALGVVLYELVTGNLPRTIARLTVGELDKAFASDPPSVTGRPLAGIPPSRTNRLPADLDAILRRALEPASARRYPSAAAFADDLERLLTSRPVAARRGTLRYRTQRAITRHRLPLALATVAVLALIGFAVSSRLQAKTLLRERDKVWVEATRANGVSVFLQDLLAQADPERGGGLHVTLRQALDRGAERLRNAPATNPDVRIVVLHTLGSIYRSVGAYAEAKPLLDEGFELARRHYGEDAAGTATLLFELAQWEAEAGNIGRAERAHRRALEIRRQVVPADQPAVLASLDALTRALGWSLRWVEQADIQAETLAIRRRTLGPEHPATLANQARYARSLAALDDLAGSTRLAADTLAALERSQLTNEQPGSLVAIATVRWLAGDYVGAERLHQRAYTASAALFGSEHLFTQMARHDIAITWSAMGRYDEAATILDEIRGSSLRRLGTTSVTPAIVTANLAETRRDQGQWEVSAALYRDAIATLSREDVSGPLADTRLGLAETLLASGQPAAARAEIEIALVALRANLPANHSRLAEAESLLGACLVELGEIAAGNRWMSDARDKLAGRLGAEHPRTQRAAKRLLAASPLPSGPRG